MILTRQKIRTLLLVLMLSLSVGVVLMVFTRERLTPPEQIAEDIAVEADAALSDFRYTQLEAGRTKWKLNAARGTHDTERNKTLLEEVQAEFFGDTAADNIIMTAAEAEADLELETIEARGNVVMTMAKGYRLKTQVLEYVGNPTTEREHPRLQEQIDRRDSPRAQAGGVDGMVKTAAFVELESDKIKIQGQGMTYLIEPRILHLRSDVKAQIYFGR
ncbi:MAG: LPS export ABC transporter periplasmic protein LptC [Desulfuromonadaceae bacterium]|nr:LPS export ABC transporter periplasmic protein LptC [Desulfuromonadaceae bacterium]